jgi:hypothetical protein
MAHPEGAPPGRVSFSWSSSIPSLAAAGVTDTSGRTLVVPSLAFNGLASASFRVNMTFEEATGSASTLVTMAALPECALSVDPLEGAAFGGTTFTVAADCAASSALAYTFGTQGNPHHGSTRGPIDAQQV